ncbi:MAG: methyltransferase domain-containing protein, partial [Candidatus Omnitrophica bacterium]|nr:methyltransferase domain-containing protein [Candidatus Omnitrophota bacterium]
MDASKEATASLLEEELWACPSCRALIPSLSSWEASSFLCDQCGLRFPWIDGIPRFVESDSYVKSFSFEWLRHRKTQLDPSSPGESEQTFREKTGLTPEQVEGKLILDAGCGMGRFAQVVSRWGGRVVGMDLSRSVEAASENLSGYKNALF